MSVVTLGEYIVSVLGTLEQRENIKSVDFEVGLDRYGCIDERSTNRIKFTVPRREKGFSEKLPKEMNKTKES